jgi:hypothetical protein
VFSNILSLRSTLNAKDNVSHPYRTISKIVLFCILIIMFWTADKRTEMSGENGSTHCQNSICSSFLSESDFASLLLSPDI